MRGSRRALPLLVLAALLQALWPVARGAAQTTEADVHVAQAIIAIDERRYDAALAELKRALEIEPDHVEALYYTGVVYSAQRRPDLAVPFLVMARPTKAAGEVEQALRLAPGSAVTGPAERLRDTIVAARERERRLSLDASVGFTYDDNVRVVPSQDGREPLVADLRSLRHRSTGELF